MRTEISEINKTNQHNTTSTREKCTCGLCISNDEFNYLINTLENLLIDAKFTPRPLA